MALLGSEHDLVAARLEAKPGLERRHQPRERRICLFAPAAKPFGIKPIVSHGQSLSPPSGPAHGSPEELTGAFTQIRSEPFSERLTKVHLAVEHGQKPLSFLVTAGQRHDSPQFQPVLERIRVPRVGVGRPRCRPDRVRADKAYGSRANRGYLRRRGTRCTIPEKSDQTRNRKKLRPRRSPAEVRQGRLPRAPRCRARDQPPQASPGGGHEVRQAGRPLRGHGHHRRHQCVAVIATTNRDSPGRRATLRSRRSAPSVYLPATAASH
ncbi:transposase [Streptomyces pseudovenezuelae]|uniref:transposase n=1 Tax=Streptomyces pseudovenezuelae TaxID=67350 RepID=UPI003710DA8B